MPLDIATTGSGVFATAHLVAFIDDNHNDKLDLPSADGIHDRILGVSTQQIVYLDGFFPPPEVAAQGHLPVGSNLLPYQAGPKLPQIGKGAAQPIYVAAPTTPAAPRAS